MEDMAPYAVGGRIAPRLNVAQMVRQAARLAEVRPELVEAYQVALRRWWATRCFGCWGCQL